MPCLSAGSPGTGHGIDETAIRPTGMGLECLSALPVSPDFRFLSRVSDFALVLASAAVLAAEHQPAPSLSNHLHRLDQSGPSRASNSRRRPHWSMGVSETTCRSRSRRSRRSSSSARSTVNPRPSEPKSLAYDRANLYVAVRAYYSDLTLLRANRVDRNKRIWQDDNLRLYLDPFSDQQRAYVFAVNPYGVQGDTLRPAPPPVPAAAAAAVVVGRRRWRRWPRAWAHDQRPDAAAR